MPLVLGHNLQNRRSTVDFYTDTCPAPNEEELVCDDVQEARPNEEGAEVGELVPAEPTSPRLDREGAGAGEPVPTEVRVKRTVEENDMFFPHGVEPDTPTVLEVVDETQHGVDHDTYSISPDPDRPSSANKGDEKRNELTSFQVSCGVFLVYGVVMLIATSGAWVRNQEIDDLYETLALVKAYHEAGSEVRRRQQAKERLDVFMESMSEARREALHAALDEVSPQANINLIALLLGVNTSAQSSPDTNSIDEGSYDGQGGEGGFVDVVQETKLGGDEGNDEHDDAANDYVNGGASGSLRSVSPAKGGTIKVGRGRVAKLKATFQSGAAATAPSSPAEDVVARKQSRSTFSGDKG